MAIYIHEFGLLHLYTTNIFQAHFTFRMKGNEREKELCLNQENLDLCNRELFKWSMVTRKHEIIVEEKTRFEVKR